MRATTTPRRWNPWPVSIIAFFAVALLGCGTFIAFCSRHPADLITPSYYEEEIRYQGQIDRLQHAQQAPQLASVTYEPALHSIAISLPTSSSPTNLAGLIQLYRPSGMNLDKQFKLLTDSGGRQTLDTASLAPGLWKVRVSWTADGQDYFLDKQVVILPSAPPTQHAHR